MTAQPQNIDGLLDSKISIRDAISSGYMSLSILNDFGMWKRVQVIQEKDKILKTHAIEVVSEMCKVSDKTVWRAFNRYDQVTDKIVSVI